MHGVPADLPLEPFVGREINQVCLGRFQIQLHCAGTGSLHVEGRWELRDRDGELIDDAREHEQRTCYKVHRLIDVAIERFSIDPPRSFTLYFENGLALTVFDDSDRYESFSIHLDGRGRQYV